MTKTKYESIIEFIELTNPSRLPNLMRRWCRSKNCTCKYCITTHELWSWTFPDDINCLISHSQQARKISCRFWFQGLMSNTPCTSPDPHTAESDNRIAGVAVLSAHMNRKSRKVRNYREAYLWGCRETPQQFEGNMSVVIPFWVSLPKVSDHHLQH